MQVLLMTVPVLLPLAGGFFMLVMGTGREGAGKKQERNRLLFMEAVVLAASFSVWALILAGREGGREAVLFYLAGKDLKVFFRLDGAGCVFAGLVSFLWPFATLYASEYMEGEERQNSFFAFYTMAYGVTLGIAFAGNLVTLYLFYELLTLVTFPLVLHYRNRESRAASRKYLYYSIGGAAFAFMGLVFILIYGNTADFILGGVLNRGVPGFRVNTILFMYVLAFFGFGVKAALFPVHGWLPKASVAPTPVTALLHAVAVVKSGAFAILRLTYYSYGADFIRGTWAHYVVLAAVLVTIVYGSTMAVREAHLKRRLAYSTISNLSYVLFGVVMMNPLGMAAALVHMVFHALMKICAFFCAGAIMHKTEKNFVYELGGMGRQMPVTFACFTVAGLSLMGLPLFAGFISKWNLARSAVAAGGALGVTAVGVLLYSALMTGIYMLTVTVRALFPNEGEKTAALVGRTEPGWRMLAPTVLFAVLLVVFGVYSGPLVRFIMEVAEGVMV
ncbi:MAG: proton-conducting membrane transporter [Lachnospiraceae bacterium]|nr:proton-conducting membrane transporter [Lachnospiraceae bacterium]